MGNCCLKQKEQEQEKESLLVSSEISQPSWRLTIKDFEKIRLIGKGKFGRVFLVKKIDTGEYFAMKTIKKKDIQIKLLKKHIMTEKKILLESESPFIVHLQYSFQDYRKVYYVMDFIQGGELFTILRKFGKFSEEKAGFYIAELILALEHLHKNGVIYRDLKPENILIDKDGHIKLTDFGLSKIGIDDKNPNAYTICGTAEYLAPEIVNNQGYTKAVDFWSLGSLFYEMLAGLTPFYSENKSKMFENIISKNIEMKPYFSENAIDLLNKLLTVDVNFYLGYTKNEKYWSN